MTTWGVLPARAQVFLAFDWGERRIGVATGNAMTRTASTMPTITGQEPVRWQRVLTVIDEWRPDVLVVGVPYHPDGAAHHNTRRAQRFARRLHGRTGLPVVEVDERYSSTEAHALGARDADAAAACIILEQFLRSLP